MTNAEKLAKETAYDVLNKIRGICLEQHFCVDCPLYDLICNGTGNETIFPEDWRTEEMEKVAEVITNGQTAD